MVTGGIDGEATPAGAYLQQMIVRPERQPFADGAQLGLLPLLETGIGTRVDGARILHVAVEKALIEGVAEIVVGGDVGSRPGQGIAIEPVTHLVEREAEPAEAPLQAVEQRQVPGQQPHQGHRIRAGQSPSTQVSRRRCCPLQQAAIEGRIQHHQLGVQVAAAAPKL